MGVQAPPHLLAFILAIVTTVFAIIVIGLDGDADRGCGAARSLVPTFCAATGMGISAGVFGLVLGILAILWLLISELWDVGILRFVIVFGMFFVAILALIAGILNAYVSSGFGGQIAAAAAFNFFLMVTAALTGVFGWMAGGGGTAA